MLPNLHNLPNFDYSSDQGTDRMVQTDTFSTYLLRRDEILPHSAKPRPWCREGWLTSSLSGTCF